MNDMCSHIFDIQFKNAKHMQSTNMFIYKHPFLSRYIKPSTSIPTNTQINRQLNNHDNDNCPNLGHAWWDIKKVYQLHTHTCTLTNNVQTGAYCWQHQDRRQPTFPGFCLWLERPVPNKFDVAFSFDKTMRQVKRIWSEKVFWKYIWFGDVFFTIRTIWRVFTFFFLARNYCYFERKKYICKQISLNK